MPSSVPIEWPEEWDISEGWPSATMAIPGDGRSWRQADSSLKSIGSSLITLRAQLGARTYSGSLPLASEQEIIRRAKGLTRREYEAKRTTWTERWRRFFPATNRFDFYYGKNFSEMLKGGRVVTGLPLAPLAEIARRASGLSLQEYERARWAWIEETRLLFPAAASFQQRFGQSFNEVAGKPKGLRQVTASLKEVSQKCRGLSGAKYDKIRADLTRTTGRFFPAHNYFRHYYGKPFAEVRDGR